MSDYSIYLYNTVTNSLVNNIPITLDTFTSAFANSFVWTAIVILVNNDEAVLSFDLNYFGPPIATATWSLVDINNGSGTIIPPEKTIALKTFNPNNPSNTNSLTNINLSKTRGIILDFLYIYSNYRGRTFNLSITNVNKKTCSSCDQTGLKCNDQVFDCTQYKSVYCPGSCDTNSSCVKSGDQYVCQGTPSPPCNCTKFNTDGTCADGTCSNCGDCNGQCNVECSGKDQYCVKDANNSFSCQTQCDCNNKCGGCDGTCNGACDGTDLCQSDSKTNKYSCVSKDTCTCNKCGDCDGCPTGPCDDKNSICQQDPNTKKYVCVKKKSPLPWIIIGAVIVGVLAFGGTFLYLKYQNKPKVQFRRRR